MFALDNKSLGHLAPSAGRVLEQTEKIEEALPSNPSIDLGGSKSRPRIEDFVFFAAAQRAAERWEDGITCAETFPVIRYLANLMVVASTKSRTNVSYSRHIPGSRALAPLLPLL
jgi:hypothetical protein